MLKQTQYRTHSFVQFIIGTIYRQFYYIFSSITFVLRINSVSRRKFGRFLRPVATLVPIGTDVDLSEEKWCLKNTDEYIEFPLKSPVVVLTDIISSTRLFNEHPQKMKQHIIAHHREILSLLRRHNGHLVANEGDSFHMAFQHFEGAVKFCKELIRWHCSEASLFRVRVGINKGHLSVRKFCGYKVYGESIEEIQEFFGHNDGMRICIKRQLIEKYNAALENTFCIH